MKNQLITYPAFFEQIAHFYGSVREGINFGMPERMKRENAVGVHSMGVLGELIAMYYIDQEGKSYQVPQLLSSRPLQEPDVIMGNFRFDVKTRGKERDLLLVNKEAHKKQKGVTHYWFVHLIGNYQARMWIYPKAAIELWPSKVFGKSEAYFKEIQKIIV